MEIFFKIKSFFLVASIAISSFVLVILSIAFAASLVKENKIEKFFKSHGYEKRLANVPAYGSGAVYSWVRECDSKRATYKEIQCLSLKQIKEKYE